MHATCTVQLSQAQVAVLRAALQTAFNAQHKHADAFSCAETPEAIASELYIMFADVFNSSEPESLVHGFCL